MQHISKYLNKYETKRKYTVIIKMEVTAESKEDAEYKAMNDIQNKNFKLTII